MRKQTVVGAVLGIALLVMAVNIPLVMAKPEKYDPLPDLPGFFMTEKNNNSISAHAFWHYKGNPKNYDAHCDAWSAAYFADSENTPDLTGSAC